MHCRPPVCIRWPPWRWSAGPTRPAQYLHASGFLATYLAALVLGNSRLPHRASTLSFAEGFGWLAQIGLFVLLGLYVDPYELPKALLPGAAIGLLVLVVARPISVLAAALPFRLPWREQAFLSWSGLRGAVPIVLALIPLMLRNDAQSKSMVNIIVVVVVIYTLVQGTSLPWVARKLDVIQPGQATEIQVEAAPLEEMNAQVLQITVPQKSRMHGVYVSQLRLPPSAVIALIVRDGSPVRRRADGAAAGRRSAADRHPGEGSGGYRATAAGGQSGRRAGVLVRRAWRPEGRLTWDTGRVDRSNEPEQPAE